MPLSARGLYLCKSSENYLLPIFKAEIIIRKVTAIVASVVPAHPAIGNVIVPMPAASGAAFLIHGLPPNPS